jgi:transcriptional regulator with XRE-family HTH domain
MTVLSHDLFRIADILKEKGISLKDFSEMLQPEGSDNERSTYSYVTQIVRNQKFPRPEKLREIAKALDVDIRELFNSTKPVEILDESNSTPIFKKDDNGNFVEIGYLKN